jgi:hypothetical protein
MTIFQLDFIRFGLKDMLDVLLVSFIPTWRLLVSSYWS